MIVICSLIMTVGVSLIVWLLSKYFYTDCIDELDITLLKVVVIDPVTWEKIRRAAAKCPCLTGQVPVWKNTNPGTVPDFVTCPACKGTGIDEAAWKKLLKKDCVDTKGE